MKTLFYLIAITVTLMTFVTAAAETGFYKNKDIEGNQTVKEGDFLIYANTAAEVYFFHVIDMGNENGGEDDSGNVTTYNLTGRKYKMEYSFKPVYMASAEGFIRWKFLQFDGLYKSNRFQKNGSIEYDNTDAVSQLPKGELVSEVLKVGIKFFDLETSYRSVQFDFGTASVVDVDNDEVVDKGKIKLNIKEFNTKYRIPGVFKRQDYSLLICYNYLSYSLPRIVYLYEDTNPSEDDDEWVYTGETIPQTLDLNSHLVGLGLSLGERKSLDGFFSAELYVGAGKSKMDFYENGSDENELVTKNKMVYTSKVNTAMGISWKLPPDSFVTGAIRLTYEINLMGYSGINGFTNAEEGEDEDSDTGRTDYGFNSFDILQGIFLSANAYF